MNTEIILKIQSAIVASNIDDVAASVRAEIAKVNTDLKTDEDFAAAEQQVKDFKTPRTPSRKHAMLRFPKRKTCANYSTPPTKSSRCWHKPALPSTNR